MRHYINISFNNGCYDGSSHDFFLLFDFVLFPRVEDVPTFETIRVETIPSVVPDDDSEVPTPPPAVSSEALAMQTPMEVSDEQLEMMDATAFIIGG